MKSKWVLALILTLAGLFALAPAVCADLANVVKNGRFEDEFILGVGKHWSPFNNGGYASYRYADDTWSKTVYDGEHSQLIGIHTRGVGGSQSDRYLGIYQVVDVVPGGEYMFSFHGMARSTEGDEQQSKWNYRVQIGFDHNGETDPWAVTDWTEMPWPEHHRLSPGPFRSYSCGITPTSKKLTIFIRVWKKFPTVDQEADINIDGVSLVGPIPGEAGSTLSPTPPAEVEKAPILPPAGAGSILPILGAGLAILATSLTARRLFRPR